MVSGPNRSLFFESRHRAMAKHLRGESTAVRATGLLTRLAGEESVVLFEASTAAVIRVGRGA